MTFQYLLLISFITIASAQQPTKVGFAYQPYPDVIKCGNYFYYLMLTSPTLSKYNAFTGSSSSIQSYDASNGVLSNKVGNLVGSCENETIDSLWANKRAFRLFNLNRPPNRSIQNNMFPDVIQCENGTLLYRALKSGGQIQYRNPTGPILRFNEVSGSLNQSVNIACGQKSLNARATDSEAYNIATQVSQAAAPSISMTADFPDFLRCGQDLYIHFISADKTQVTYRSVDPNINVEIQFRNGQYLSDQFGFFASECTNKSIATLISQGKAFNLNTPVLQCPNDIISSNPLVTFKAVFSGGLNLSYSHQSNTSFPIGEKTTVSITATHTNSSINLQCQFTVNILGGESESDSINLVVLIVSIVGGVIVLTGIILGQIAIAKCRKNKKACFKEKKKVNQSKTYDGIKLDQRAEQK